MVTMPELPLAVGLSCLVVAATVVVEASVAAAAVVVGAAVDELLVEVPELLLLDRLDDVEVPVDR